VTVGTILAPSSTMWVLPAAAGTDPFCDQGLNAGYPWSNISQTTNLWQTSSGVGSAQPGRELVHRL
jgi:hypothetical protein